MLLLGLAALGAAVGCGDDDGHTREAAASSVPPPPPVPEIRMVATELAPAGIEATVLAPEGTEVTERFGAAEVAGPGTGFRLVVAEGEADLAARKRAIERNRLNVLRRFVVDDPRAVLYESEVAGRVEFHVIVNARLGDTGYRCEDARGTTYTLEQARRMLDACRSLAGR